MRGSVGVDWVIGLGVFLIFVSISFTYYSSMFQKEASPLEDAADYVADQVMGYLKVDVYDVPVRFYAPGSASSQVLYFNYTWPYGKETTQVYSGTTGLPCYISGDTVYWRSDVSAGYNYFRVRYSNQTTAMRCTSSLDLSQLNKTAPFAAERQQMLSRAKVNEMLSASYGAFSDSLDLNMDFRLYLNESGTVTEYGLSPPNATSTRVVTRWGRMEDNNNEAELRILVW